MDNFSFDEWATLYNNDPVEFERKRKEVIDAEIAKSPPEKRPMLKVLQLQCDSIRATMSPLDATIEISKMMNKKVGELKTPLTQLRGLLEDTLED